MFVHNEQRLRIGALSLSRAELDVIRPTHGLPDLNGVQVEFSGGLSVPLRWRVLDTTGHYRSAPPPAGVQTAIAALIADAALAADLAALRSPAPTLSEAKARQRAAARQERDRQEALVILDGRANTIPAGTKVSERFTAAVDYSRDHPSTAVPWEHDDGSVLGYVWAPSQGSGWQAFRDARVARGLAVNAALAVHLAAIDALASVGQVEAYDVGAGWPG